MFKIIFYSDVCRGATADRPPRERLQTGQQAVSPVPRPPRIKPDGSGTAAMSAAIVAWYCIQIDHDAFFADIGVGGVIEAGRMLGGEGREGTGILVHQADQSAALVEHSAAGVAIGVECFLVGSRRDC